ncbi:MAG: hypothetical protein Q9227_009370 [Pyrenula ochraceoflavens]
MQFPKLTPLQSRFAASLLASAILIIIYFSLSRPPFAYAAELDERIPPDHNHPILLETEESFDDLHDGSLDQMHLEPMSDSHILARQSTPTDINALANNDPQPMNIKAGETQNWVFKKEALAGPFSPQTPGLPSVVERENTEFRQELRKRQDSDIPGGSRTLWISLNTCLQPSANSSSNIVPPQLEVYVSQSQDLQRPGPSQSMDNQKKFELDDGFAQIQLDASDSIYVGVTAPNTSDFSGIWNYEVAGSIDAPYHEFDANSPNLYFVDSDSHAALLVTNDTTQAQPNETVYQKWMDMQPPFSMFAHNQDNPAILGVQKSYCGLKQYAQLSASRETGDASMTNRGIGSKPKEQFYIQRLNTSATYIGFLAMNGNSTDAGNGVVGGGGKVWKAMNFTTKSVAYAVPSNPSKKIDELSAIYDKYASDMYQFFNFSLQQIPCNTTATAQYSLARTCDDCAAAYKQWLCAVTIPRCEDYSNPSEWLMPRNTGQKFINGSSIDVDQSLLTSVAFNSSRNSIIDADIQPGPYKEVLPCKDLCYDLVQSCPATLGFGCPLEGKGMNVSYGNRDPTGLITCSYLGAAYFLNGGSKIIDAAGTSVFWVSGVLTLWLLML